MNPDLPTVYFSLGSEGLGELVAHLGELARQGMQIVVATGDANLSAQDYPPHGVYLERYVNTEILLPRCELVCCHGGNGTLYQALWHGLPTVVVATHAEQHYGGKRIQQLGLGRTLSLKKLQRRGMGSLVDLVYRVQRNPTYRQNALQFSHHVKSWNGAQLAANEVERYMLS